MRRRLRLPSDLVERFLRTLSCAECRPRGSRRRRPVVSSKRRRERERVANITHKRTDGLVDRVDQGDGGCADERRSPQTRVLPPPNQECSSALPRAAAGQKMTRRAYAPSVVTRRTGVGSSILIIIFDDAHTHKQQRLSSLTRYHHLGTSAPRLPTSKGADLSRVEGRPSPVEIQGAG
jgi:hypothetical protein